MDKQTKAALVGMAVSGWSRVPVFPFPPAPVPKPERKCLRPDCGNTHRHNGGYCSADCCQRHREEKKHAQSL